MYLQKTLEIHTNALALGEQVYLWLHDDFLPHFVVRFNFQVVDSSF